MYITKKHIARRTVLRGMGVSLALPFLEAMVPAATALAKTAAVTPPRMGFFYLPMGAIMANTPWGEEMNAWTPSKDGRDFDLKPILKPFAPYQEHLTVISGLDNKPGASSAPHAIIPGTWLGCVHPPQQQATHGGVTVDQVAAQHIGQDTALPSIELAAEGGNNASAACDRNFGCSYADTISFSTPSTPLPMESNPQKVFQKLFGQGRTAEEREAISSDYKSILDFVSEETSALKGSLGAHDRATFDDYLQKVREIERRVKKMADRDLSGLTLPEVPVNVPPINENLPLMFDMISLAYQANLTRVASLMMAAEATATAYTHLGIPDAFHPLSHHGNVKESLEKLVRIQTYHSKVFVDFLGKLKEIPDGESSVLDNAIFLYGGNMSNSDLHNSFPLPTLVVGRGGGRIKGNQHLRYADHEPLANVHLTLLHRVGIPVETFGDDGTRELTEI